MPRGRSWLGRDLVALPRRVIGLVRVLLADRPPGAWIEQAPAVRRGLSELLLHACYQTYGLSRPGYRRILDGAAPHDEVPRA